MEDYDICNLALSLIGAGAITALATTGSKETIESNRWYAHCRDAVLRDHDWNFARKRLELTELREIEFDAGKTAEPAVAATITSAAGETGVIVYVYIVTGTFALTTAAGMFVVSGLTDVFDDNEAITWSGGSATTNEPDEMGTTDYTDWNYCYQYPSDCLAIRRIMDDAGTLTGTSYDIDEDREVTVGLVKFEIALHESKALRVILTDKEDAEAIYTAQVTDPDLFDRQFIDALVLYLASKFSAVIRKDEAMSQKYLQEYLAFLGMAKARSANEGHNPPDEVSSFQRARN